MTEKFHETSEATTTGENFSEEIMRKLVPTNQEYRFSGSNRSACYLSSRPDWIREIGVAERAFTQSQVVNIPNLHWNIPRCIEVEVRSSICGENDRNESINGHHSNNESSSRLIVEW
jgi:hypothetical protein